MSTLKANTILAASGLAADPVAIPGLDKRFATAWVNFNGSGAVSIRSAYNVASITDNGVGDYTINFTVAMANVNYAPVAMGGYRDGGTTPASVATSAATPPSVMGIRLVAWYTTAGSGQGVVDTQMVALTVFGGRA